MILTLVSHSLEGHRREYVSLFERLFSLQGWDTRVATHWREALADRAPSFFLMIEESFGGYVVAAVVRAALGRRTVGLLFRGREAVSGNSLRLRVKRMVLSVLRRVPNISTISIVPFNVDPRLAGVADAWIDDPQLWDVEDTSLTTTPLSVDLVAAANGRGLVVSLGGQSEAKGFRFFAKAWAEDRSLRDRWLFVAAGKVAVAEMSLAGILRAEGGVVIDRFISDAELASLYGVADVVWGVYAPSYDQASGIFGRAVQYDVPILLRRGSTIEAHGRELSARAVAVDYGDVAQIGKGLDAVVLTPSADLRKREEMRSWNVATLVAALADRP